VSIDIKVNKDDCLGYIYFITGLAKDPMHSGLSSKSDLMGGILDRFINIIPEGIIFDKYFLPKINETYEYIGDFYRYRPVSEGIAPDLLGIRADGIEIPFAKFGDSGWQKYKNAPEIEIKTFKTNQYMISLRNQSYDDNFIVMLEFNLKADYLTPFFSDELFKTEIKDSLRMNDDVFMLDKEKHKLDQVPTIIKDDKIGDLKLLKVVKGRNFMETCDLCGPGISPRYVKEINHTRTTSSFRLDLRKHRPLKQYCSLDKNLYRFNNNWNSLFKGKNILTLGISVSDIDAIRVIKKSKSSLTIYATTDVTINGVDLLANNAYIIKFDVLSREGSTGDEYFMNKGAILANEDFEEEMINRIKNHIDDVLSEEV